VSWGVMVSAAAWLFEGVCHACVLSEQAAGPRTPASSTSSPSLRGTACRGCAQLAAAAGGAAAAGSAAVGSVMAVSASSWSLSAGGNRLAHGAVHMLRVTHGDSCTCSCQCQGREHNQCRHALWPPAPHVTAAGLGCYSCAAALL
jgi:hypothetical protein